MADIIEPAPSARAKCRACRQPIAKAELRFGEQVPNPYGEGDTHFWYHVRCAALRLPEKLEALLNSGVTVDDADQLLKIAQLAQQNPLLPKVMRVDRAPTARARCQRCRKAIDKGMLRVVLERM
ncbi:MAG TPA: hypothetical protein VL137_15795, partial [Polyangiaceae bacterium]|nr:hypothetical protein [Polyangiaceae bacterium]